MISVCFQGKLFNITVIQGCAPTSNAEEAEVEQFYEDLLELAPKKDVLFIIGDWNAKIGSQETPGITGKSGLGVWNEAGQRLIEFCQENALVIANTLFQQHKRRLYTWTSPDGRHRNQINYIPCSQSWRSSIQSAKTRPGADCGSDHELLIAKFRLKLKKIGDTTRPFGYDLNEYLRVRKKHNPHHNTFLKTSCHSHHCNTLFSHDSFLSMFPIIAFSYGNNFVVFSIERIEKINFSSMLVCLTSF